MSDATLKTYVLIGFLESGRSNIICVTQAESDYAAAAKLGGRLIEPAEISRDDQTVYAARLPPSPSGVSWGQFRFESEAGIEALAKIEPPGKWLNNVRNVATNVDHLVLAEVPFLE